MRKQKPRKNKKINQMSLKELKRKAEDLELIGDNSAYLKHLNDAISTYYFRRG